MAESDIQADVLIAVTALPGAFFWRQNSGVFRTMDGRRIVKASATGVADIIGCYRGKAVAIECKTFTGKQLKTQRIFQRAWELAGGIYIIARSGAEALKALA